MFGTNTSSLILQLFGHDPMTTSISEDQFELLLKLTHEHIRQKYSALMKDRIQLFFGPQCNHDRMDNERMKYNPKIRKTLQSTGQKERQGHSSNDLNVNGY